MVVLYQTFHFPELGLDLASVRGERQSMPGMQKVAPNISPHLGTMKEEATFFTAKPQYALWFAQWFAL